MQSTIYGERWQNRKSRNAVGGALDTVKVGTGGGAESDTDTGLASEAYASADSSEVTLVESADGTQTTYYIELQGAQQVPAGTEISEVGVFVGGTAPDGSAVDFGDLQQYTDDDGDLMHTRDTAPQTTIADGSLVIERITISWRRL